MVEEAQVPLGGAFSSVKSTSGVLPEIPKNLLFTRLVWDGTATLALFTKKLLLSRTFELSGLTVSCILREGVAYTYWLKKVGNIRVCACAKIAVN